MSDIRTISPQLASRVQRDAKHNVNSARSDRQPIYAKAAAATVGNRDAGGARSRFSRQGDDEVFYPNNTHGRNLATPGPQYGAGVARVVNGQVPTIAPYVRERLLLGLPATAQYIAPHEFPATLDYEKGRVIVTPLQLAEPVVLHGTVVTTAMNAIDSYF